VLKWPAYSTEPMVNEQYDGDHHGADIARIYRYAAFRPNAARVVVVPSRSRGGAGSER
jgi:hypothetical protein